MCLFCEWKLATCSEQECIDAADPDDVYHGRSVTCYMWRGYDEPCKHIKEWYLDWEDDMLDPDE